MSCTCGESPGLVRPGQRGILPLVLGFCVLLGGLEAQVDWRQTPQTVLDVGGPDSWDSESVFVESALPLPDGRFAIWYRGTNDPAAEVDWQIGCALSSDFVNWQKHSGEPCFAFGPADRWDELSFGASVLFDQESGLFEMWYGAAAEENSTAMRIGHAISEDGIVWSRVGDGPVLEPEAPWERTSVDSPRVLKRDGLYHMWYTGREFRDVSSWQIGYATSEDGIHWEREPGNPVLSGGGVGEPDAVYIPSVLVDEETGLFEMWFVHRTPTRIALGYALSLDGRTWTEWQGNPLLLTTLLPVRGVLTGAVVRQGDGYEMLYNGWWGGEIYRGHHARAAWTLPRPSFSVERKGNQVFVDASRSTAPVEIASYRWDFGDGALDEGPLAATTHQYSPGTYRLELRVTTSAGESAEVAREIRIPHPIGPFLRGDCDGDGRATGSVTDAVFLLTFSFLGGAAPACLAACDADGDGQVAGQVTDAVYLLSHSFLGGPAPPMPFPKCAQSSRSGDVRLGCAAASLCP